MIRTQSNVSIHVGLLLLVCPSVLCRTFSMRSQEPINVKSITLTDFLYVTRLYRNHPTGLASFFYICKSSSEQIDVIMLLASGSFSKLVINAQCIRKLPLSPFCTEAFGYSLTTCSPIVFPLIGVLWWN